MEDGGEMIYGHVKAASGLAGPSLYFILGASPSFILLHSMSIRVQDIKHLAISTQHGDDNADGIVFLLHMIAIYFRIELGEIIYR